MDYAAMIYASPYFLGVIATLLLYAFLQDRILLYPRDSSHILVVTFEVFCNRVAAICFACVQLRRKGEPLQTIVPKKLYVAIVATHILASASQWQMVRHLPHGAQVIGKSFKMIPVMLCSLVVVGARYTVVGWATALTLSLGLVQMLLGAAPFEPGGPGADLEDDQMLIGVSCLVSFFLCESFALCAQEKIFVEMKVSVYDQMLYINSGASVVSLLVMLYTGSFYNTLMFCCGNPIFLLEVVLLCVVSVAAQWLIYSQLRAHGVEVVALTLTVRQVAAFLLAYFSLGKSISFVQYIGLLVVVASLLQMSQSSLRMQPTEQKALLDDRGCEVKEEVVAQSKTAV